MTKIKRRRQKTKAKDETFIQGVRVFLYPEEVGELQDGLLTNLWAKLTGAPCGATVATLFHGAAKNVIAVSR